MNTDKPNLADGNEPEGHQQLDSHVQGQPPVYGEPKGPRPGTMFRHKDGVPQPPDRERDGFVSGPDVVGLGDIVGSGPEEWERSKKPGTESEDSKNDDKAAG
ncbi:hypothetical protein [Kaistia terrae]|uniref:Uncharacterized protein n=1 Tax=Kaistia terrae TaxID=537017 RepID=A0ABW0PZI9_9HYPH|nr:hypothetical protein [Kaistia terrae]MCX5581752.1 hypothetical protein [Kaistia terrae]